MIGLREECAKVMHLQFEYSSLPTDAMHQRGIIIKNRIPELLGQHSEKLRLAARIDAEDFLITGRDGIGRKSRVPWVRFGSRTRSPSAAIGWYVVWLFREDGSGVYLSISHASTQKADGEFVKRTDFEIRRLKNLAWEILSNDVKEDPRILTAISLGRGKLAKAYESTTVASYFYPREAIPSDLQLHADMEAMSNRLSKIYAVEPILKWTKETSLDVISALAAFQKATSGRSGAEQGFGLTHPQRRAIEMRAMEIAIQHFRDDGYSVEDTSSRMPYDLLITKGDKLQFIEVKGTTGGLGDILLTKNEVEHHRKNFPNNGLFVLHGIQLNRDLDCPVAGGGTPYFETPWQVDSDRLQAIAYRYRIA